MSFFCQVNINQSDLECFDKCTAVGHKSCGGTALEAAAIGILHTAVGPV